MLSLIWAVAMAADPVAPPPEADSLRRSLSMRHAVPCVELEAGLAEPVPALLWAVSEVQQPPWAGMHAAECLTRGHAAEVQAELVRWVSEPELAGLGRQTLAMIDLVPVEVALPVARAALAGPVADKALETVKTDARPEIRALAVAP